MSHRCSRLVVVAVILAMHAALTALTAGPAHAYWYTVTSLADDTVADGVCTLREAMLAANNTPANADCGPGSVGVDHINVHVSGTIVLRAALPRITDSVLIFNSSIGVTLDGNRSVRPFVIDRGIDVTLERLTITNAQAPTQPGGLYGGGRGEDGGAIHNSGRLSLIDVRITHSTAGRGGAGFYGGGHGGHGGAIYNAGGIVGYRVTFDKNSAGFGGTDQHGSYAQAGHGGAIFNGAGSTVTLYAATFTGNLQGGGEAGQGATLYTQGPAMFKASTFSGNGSFMFPFSLTSSIVTDGSGAVRLSSSILGDGRQCGGALGSSGTFVDGGYNLGFANGGCPLTSAAGSIPNASPPVLEQELRNHGGVVPTLSLLSTSSAVDKVPASFEDCAEGKLVHLGLPSTLTDARGVARPQNGSCDIGAYELGPSFRIGLRTVVITGAGSGYGTVSGEGLECGIVAGVSSGKCTAQYGSRTVVTLTATAAADSIFVGWAGDPECSDGSILMDGDKSCTAVFDLRGVSVRGAASGIGHVPLPESAGSAEVSVSAKFPFAGVINLASATLTITMLLGEDEDGGAGELVQGVPIVLQPRPGSRSTKATFETPPGPAPGVTVKVHLKESSLSTIDITVERATLLRVPQLCWFGSPPSTTLTTMFVIDDGINPPLTVTATEPWRCLDTEGDLLVPGSLKTP